MNYFYELYLNEEEILDIIMDNPDLEGQDLLDKLNEVADEKFDMFYFDEVGGNFVEGKPFVSNSGITYVRVGDEVISYKMEA